MLPLSTLLAVLGLLSPASAQAAAGTTKLAGTFRTNIASSGVSSLQWYLGNENKLYILDKTENNPITVVNANGQEHPAWATEVDITTWKLRTMPVTSNTFCAGGATLGNGTMINIGGNQWIGTGGNNVNGVQGPYYDDDGRKAIRFLNACDDEKCQWLDDPNMYMAHERWYPTVEPMADGSVMILGGCQNGGYVNDPGQDNPTIEFWPAREGGLIQLDVITSTNPVNLYPLAWLLPSGNVLIQSGWRTAVYDVNANTEYPISDMPHAYRVYPASAGTAMLPLTPDTNWTASVIFCGGGNYEDYTSWQPSARMLTIVASTSCVQINPDVEDRWYEEDDLPAGRTMGQFVNLPDGRLLFANGANLGTAGYGATDKWAVGESYADGPELDALYFDKTKPAGQHWVKAGTAITPRMYHSVATLLPDGSVAISGSNPNADYIDPENPPDDRYKYGTDTTIDIFYPDYYDHERPKPTNLPKTLTYGGNFWNVSLTQADLFGDTMNIQKTQAVIIRTGYSTHGMNFGMRHVQLNSTYQTADNGGATLFVSQMPPNPNVLAPGPALLFIVVNGIPSQGQWIMVGDGIVGTHSVQPAQDLPPSAINKDYVSASAAAGQPAATDAATDPAATGAAAADPAAVDPAAAGADAAATPAAPA